MVRFLLNMAGGSFLLERLFFDEDFLYDEFDFEELEFVYDLLSRFIGL